MHTIDYLDTFKQVASHLNRQSFNQKDLDYKVGIWLHSPALKIQKKSWLNPTPDAKPFEESIFFSVWLNDQTIRESRLYYNIHALQLRQLKGHSIKSREFAEAFRLAFTPFEQHWPNVSTHFGPLTLMEGWTVFNDRNVEGLISDLAYRFSEISFIIDDLLAERKINTHH